MIKEFLFILCLSLPVFLFSQPQLEIQGDPASTDTVATIKVNYTGLSNTIGLAVRSAPISALGIAGSFYGGFRGVVAESSVGIGLVSSSTANYGMMATSTDYFGGYFKGGGGVAIELGGVDSEWETGEDDGVIRSEQDQMHGDLILVSNDEIDLHLDADNNSTGHFKIMNGEASTIFSLNESGKLTLHGLNILTYTPQYDTAAIIRYSGPNGGVGLKVEVSSDTCCTVGGSFYAFGTGVKGSSVGGMGISGSSIHGTGLYGNSTSGYGIYGMSDESTGAYIKGGGGIAIELGGANSVYGDDNDDGVIRSQASQADGDLVIVSNDVIALHLDDDNNNTNSVLEVRNGANEEILILDETGNLSISGVYSPSSDKNLKERITPVDPYEILTKVASIPISEWQFKGDSSRHIGPMAQDFYAAFGLGQGETTIATVDADGVALGAIRALKNENDELKKENESLIRAYTLLKQEDAEMKRKLASLAARLERIEHMMADGRKLSGTQ